MRIKLFLDKTIEQNAAMYFEKAKKLKKKLEGARKAAEKRKKENIKQEIIEEKKERKKEWYEKFHWFISSEEFLCIGGRDATSNDILVKKHTDTQDLVFHTEMPGSPFFIIKTEGKEVGEETQKETAQATASYSKAWKANLTITEVYMVKADQVKKELGLPKGTFMIRGKRKYFSPKLEIAIGIKDKQIIGGPENAVSSYTNKYLIIVQGKDKKSDVAKKIKHKLGGGELDEIIRFLPAGGCQISKH